MAIGDQAGKDIDETIAWAAMASMLNLRDIFELINDAFEDGTFAQEQFVHQREQAVFHVFLEFGDELNAERLQELFKEWLRDIPAICDQLSKQAFAKRWNWFAIMHIARGNLASQEFSTIIDHQRELETVKPAHRTLASLSKLGTYLVSVNAMVVTHPQGAGVKERNPVTAPVQAIQIGAQRSQDGRHQNYKTLITHQFRKLRPQVLADMFRVIGFEGSVARLMKIDHDCHDCTDTQLPWTVTFFASLLD